MATSEAEGVDGYRLRLRYRLLSHAKSAEIRRITSPLVVSSRWRWNPQNGTRFTVPAMRGVPLTAHPLTAHRLDAPTAPANCLRGRKCVVALAVFRFDFVEPAPARH